MTELIIPANVEICPLCHKPWAKTLKAGRMILFCVRPGCMISVFADDPMIQKWPQFEVVPCSFCNTGMRLFARSDTYMKLKCPKCSCVIESEDPAIHYRKDRKAEIDQTTLKKLIEKENDERPGNAKI